MLKAFLDIIFPPRCHACKTFIPDAGPLHLCAACLESCQFIGSPLCKKCGVPFLTSGGDDHFCGDCITGPPCFTSARAAALFAGPVKELIHRFKYSRQVQICRPLGVLAGEQLLQWARAVAADLLIPVPLHKKRLRQREFNQALLLGETLAQQWQLPVSRRNLQRVRWTEPQINLSAPERIANVRGAFAISDPDALCNKRIILVDDVYTTGSTVAECARVLFRAKVAEVHVVTIARATL